MKTNSFLKVFGGAFLMAALTSGVMAQTSGGQSPTTYPAVRPHDNTINGRPATPQEGMPPVMGQPQNGNGSLTRPGVPMQPSAPLSPTFFSNSIANQPTRRATFAATNPPPNVTSFPFTNATGPFPKNPASGRVPQ